MAIQGAINEVVRTIIGALAIVIVLIDLFLGSLRSVPGGKQRGEAGEPGADTKKPGSAGCRVSVGRDPARSGRN